MKSEELRAKQAPLKSKYKENPETALITFIAKGRISKDATFTIETGKRTPLAGLHPAAGGDSTGICSGDVLMEALASCAGVTMGAVSTAMGIELMEAVVTATGIADFRGTLGVSKEVPVGFTKINLHFELSTEAPKEQIETLIKLTERYCIVYQTLRAAPEITVTHN
jgi:uncharacterized OsmC-like protein